MERTSTPPWEALAAPLPKGAISWRQDGKPTKRGDKFFARFVAFIDATTVRDRLDATVPGEWDLSLELLPPQTMSGNDDERHTASFKARLQILGVIREDVGTGKDYKSAATDAFKRAATRFGIGSELYALGQNWVQVDSDSRYAKPLEDPQEAYDRRGGSAPAPAQRQVADPGLPRALRDQPDDDEPITPRNAPHGGVIPPNSSEVGDNPDCPKCGGRMYDNRETKRNPKAPDFRCRDRSCDGLIWPPKGGTRKPSAPPPPPVEDFDDDDPDGPVPF